VPLAHWPSLVYQPIGALQIHLTLPTRFSEISCEVERRRKNQNQNKKTKNNTTSPKESFEFSYVYSRNYSQQRRE
jgi:hypothetical protein